MGREFVDERVDPVARRGDSFDDRGVHLDCSVVHGSARVGVGSVADAGTGPWWPDGSEP